MSKMIILAVDDSKTILALMKQMTKNMENCQLEGFVNSRDALEWCQDQHIDLLIVDYMMPDLDGITFLREFKSNSRHRHVPVLMITASEDLDIRHRSLEHGANDFLTKPLDMLEFTTRVRNMLSLRRYQKALEENIKLLRQSEERWQFALEGSGDGVWDWDTQTDAMFLSKNLKAMLGYADHELSSNYTSFMDLLHPDDLPLIQWEVQLHLQGKTPTFVVEKRMLCKDGSYKWVLTRGKIIEWATDGKPLRAVGTMSDISERKDMENYLKDSSDRMRKILDAVDALIVVTQMEGDEQILFVNHHARKLYGDIEGQPWSCFNRDTAPAQQALVDRHGNPSGEVVAWEEYDASLGRWFLRHDQGIRWVDGSVVRMQVATDITERHQIMETLQKNEKKYRELFDNMKSGVAIYDVESGGDVFVFKDVNKSAESILCARKEDLIGRNLTKALPGVEDFGLLTVLQDVYRSGSPQYFPPAHYHDDSRQGYFENFVYRLPSGEVVAIFDDVTEEKLAEQELRLAAKVFESSMDAIVITDRHNAIVSVNQAFTTITGYSREEVIGHNPNLLSSGRQDEEFYHQMWQSLLHLGQWKGEIWNRRKNGEIYPQWVSISTATDADNAITHYIAIFSDISERKAAEERIQYLAWHDPLTGLPNRALLQDRLERALVLARRNEHQLAVLFVDLDRFKIINDTLGHHMGDLLLQEVAKRLCACVRQSDTVSRQGGDEFVILLLDITGADAAAMVASKIVEAIARPFTIDGHCLHTSPSVGISLYPHHGRDKASLLKKADGAMYKAKDMGRNNFQFADDDESEGEQQE